MSVIAAIRAICELPVALKELSQELRSLNDVFIKARAAERRQDKDEAVDRIIDDLIADSLRNGKSGELRATNGED